MNLFKSEKYKFFEKKIDAVEKTIWELDFKVAKSKQVREGVRQDRERSIEALQKIEVAAKNEKDAGKKKELEEQRDKISADVKRYEAQMKMIDDQITGVPAVGDNPGAEGINDQIAGYSELREMYKQYLTTI